MIRIANREKIYWAYRVHTRHAHCSLDGVCVLGPFATLGDNFMESEVPVPSVRPPPLMGAIPSDSFLRISISD